jgi:hypothetical protein
LPKQIGASVAAEGSRVEEVARIVIPAPRPALEQPQPVPFQLPWSRPRAACRPVIGDALLLQFMLHRCSVRSMTELTVRQAREMLTAWAAEQGEVASRRDEVVRAAVAAGLSKSEVYRLTGIARTTIDRIVSPVREPGEESPG